ncbi:stage VI sporulation protein D [Virgibacillus sp. NKC19-3]|uniref:stage VI sporulation protein D n=1 Tax=Virgibacillus saliphilus TaxID=2831674 RepID=UPI001C9A9962|nr:stage VI sporulation protein D [Virgibacillus sp. NKC19-3]MBY7143244.1 stage VI sporulation protein D [Virgibacillus sp. NKC19-3]
MSNDQSVFSFELNESLYFEKGQEVAEIRGISLDPEISIQSFHEYISIRGVIELNGEYQKVEYPEEEPYPNDFEDVHSNRYVESVIDTEDGTAAFSHQFPVEISIPSYRVTNLDDVTVNIASFDYEIPDQNQLKLTSTIVIDGINSQTDREEEEDVEEQVKVDEAFQFEVKEEPEKESPDMIASIDPTDIPALSTETEEESIEDNRWKTKKSQTLKEFFDNLSSKEEEETAPEFSEDPNDYESPEFPEDPQDFSNDNYTEESHEIYESMESRSASMENVSYLSDMFRNTEEEQYTKMKLCIVQEKDTIDTIAERYQISALQLIKQNQLDDEYKVTEGQLLYIPNRK